MAGIGIIKVLHPQFPIGYPLKAINSDHKKGPGVLTWAFGDQYQRSYLMSLHFPNFSLKMRWRIFPVGVMGISSSLMISTDFGILYPAIFPRQWSISSFSVAVFPSWNVTTAFTDSPHFSWGMPITATYFTAGWDPITFSTSDGKTFSPPGMLMLAFRSTKT